MCSTRRPVDQKRRPENGEAVLKPRRKILKQCPNDHRPRLPEDLQGRTLNPLLIKKLGGYQPSIHINADNEINIVGLPKFHSRISTGV